MLNFKKTGWGLLVVMTIGAVEPAVWAAPPEVPGVPKTSGVVGEATLGNVFGSNGVPTAIKLKELTPDWRGMTTNGQLEIGNLQTFVGAFAGGSFATHYYTKGQTVTIGSETYIVAYSLLSLVDKITPDTPLNLSLLNLKTIGSLSNIRTFDTAKETKVLEKQLAALQLSNVFDPTSKPPEVMPPEVTPPPEVAPKPKPKPKPVRRKRRTVR